MALGFSSVSAGQLSVAIGSGADASKNGAVAIGGNASASGVDAIAIGLGATATGSVAIGLNASAANGGAAFGDNSVATATLATAVGPGASATGANSVAIGSGSVATAANTVSFGSAGNQRVLTNVASGSVAAGSTDVVNGGQLFTTNQNVAAAVASANTALAMGQNAVQYDNPGHTSITLHPGGAPVAIHNVAPGVAPNDAATVSQLNGFGAGLKSNVFSGIAASVAMGGAPTPSAPGRTTVAMQSGFFENYAGIGLAFAHRLDTDTPIQIEGSYAHAGSENVGRVGVAIEF